MRIILRATGALAIGLVALALITMSVFSPSGTDADTGVNDGSAGSVEQVAVDMDTTGNDPGTGGGNTLSPIEATSALPVGGTQDIDIIVDEVNASDGLAGFGLNLKFNEAVLIINTMDVNSFMLTGAFGINPMIPGTCFAVPCDTGNLRMDQGWIGGNVSGEGVLVRLGIECLADGSSPLDLTDDISDGVEILVNPLGVPIPVDNLVDGSIICGAGDPDTPTPTPPTDTDTPTPTPPPNGTDTPTPTDAPTPTATDAPTPTATDAPTPTATAVPTPTATPTATAAPTTTSAPGTATPGALPPTGASDGGGLSLPWTIWLMLAAGLFITSFGIAVITRSQGRTRN